jgi:esterase
MNHPPLELHYREFREAGAHGLPLLLLHGMLGSSSNWLGIARGLRQRHPVLIPDLRNHGRSPQHPAMDYPAMAADLIRLADGLGLGRFVPIGHSMGAKVAMWLALHCPDRVEGLVALDMAPVTYPPRFGHIFAAMRGLPLHQLPHRPAADAHLARQLDDPRLRAFLLQNLVQREGRWAWRVNLDAIIDQREELRGFPQLPPQRQYPGPALFLYGDRSDYLQPEHWPAIRDRFPFARLRPVTDAGHWVYAERPQEVLTALQGFLREL